MLSPLKLTKQPLPTSIFPVFNLTEGIDVAEATYFLSHLEVVPGGPFEMARWRKRIYCALSRNASSPTDYFCLPANRTITVGSQLAL